MVENNVTRVNVTAAGGPGALRLETATLPVPRKDEVAIRMEAAGVAFVDVLLRQGRLPTKPPIVPGFDVVGRVTAVGPGVEGLTVGQRVAALTMTGAYASDVVSRAQWTVPVSDDLDAASVTALVLSYLTAWQMLHRVARIKAGQSILVLGAAGGVGSALTELATLDGVRVFGTASAQRHPVLEARGVTVVSDQGALAEQVDATFDPVGGPSLAPSRRATRKTGVVAAYGISFAADAGLSRLAGLIRAGLAIARAKVVPGPKLVVYTIESWGRRDPVALRADLTYLIDLLAKGAIHPEVATMPPAEAADAHRRLEGRKVVGKLVLVP